MADDNGGLHSPHWRTHMPVRMLTANSAQGFPDPCAHNYNSINVDHPVDGIAAFYQRQAGYYAYAEGDKSPSEFVSTLKHDAIRFTYGHGHSPDGGGVNMGGFALWAERAMPNPQPAYTGIFIEDYAMPKAILMVWAHCHTADTDDRNGCVYEQSYRKGVTASVGFSGYGPGFYEDYQEKSIHRAWTYYLWGYLSGNLAEDRTPKGVYESLIYAQAEVFSIYHTYAWCNNWSIKPVMVTLPDPIGEIVNDTRIVPPRTR